MELLLPLRRPPTVVQIGLNVHGRLREERYRMPGLWGIHLYHYAGSVDLGRHRQPFQPGQVTVTPPDTELVWRFPAHAPHHYALVAFPDGSDRDRVGVPVLSDLGGATEAQREAGRMEGAMAVFASDPQRACAWAWDLLWRLVPAQRSSSSGGGRITAAGVPGASGGTVPPAMQIVLTMIDLEMERPLSLLGLARRAGVGPNQLLRLFNAHCGRSVMAYVRRRRAERARHLLRDTGLPMADIAHAVGAPDLQAFNKLIRRAWGVSPRALREGPTLSAG